MTTGVVLMITTYYYCRQYYNVVSTIISKLMFGIQLYWISVEHIKTEVLINDNDNDNDEFENDDDNNDFF